MMAKGIIMESLVSKDLCGIMIGLGVLCEDYVWRISSCRAVIKLLHTQVFVLEGEFMQK
jgi:hypothetical protein